MQGPEEGKDRYKDTEEEPEALRWEGFDEEIAIGMEDIAEAAVVVPGADAGDDGDGGKASLSSDAFGLGHQSPSEALMLLGGDKVTLLSVGHNELAVDVEFPD